MKNNLFQLFMKRFFKYLILLALLIGMLVPLIDVSKSYIREIVVHNLNQNLTESTEMLEHDINKAQQMMSILTTEEAFQKLIKVQGELPINSYVYLTKLQTKLAQLSVVFDLDTMSYLVFRNTPIFISNHGCTNDYTTLMPVPAESTQKDASAWHNFLFESPYSHQLLPNMDFVSPDSAQVSSGIVFVLDIVQNSQLNPNCKMVTLLNCTQTINKVLVDNLNQDNFLYIADENGRILYQYNYENSKALDETENYETVTVNEESYQIFQANSELWGLQIVCGMTNSAMETRVQETMISWLSFYLEIGLGICLIVSLLFSIKETRSIRSLINTATKSTHSEYTRDEYTFLNHAFQTLDQSNLEKQEQIDLLNRQIEADILESLIMRGSYALKDQPDFLKYFDGHFDFFCVAIFSFKTTGQTLSPMEQQQIYVATEEILCREGLQADYYTCFLVMNPKELVCVLSLNPDESVNLNQVRNRLLQSIQILNDQLEQEEWNVTVYAGISKPAQNIINIRTAYLQAKNALSLENEVHSGEVYQYSAPRTAILKNAFDSINFQYCYDLLIKGDREEISAFFQDLNSSLSHKTYGDQEIMQLFFTLRDPIYNAYLQILSNESTEGWDEMPAFPEYTPGYTIEQVQKDFFAFCQFLCGMVEKNRKHYNDVHTQKILDYIQTHFADPELTAVQITTELLISEKYLYRVVKEASGKTFGKYLESLRMKKAENLLLTTDLTNIQIFQQCGFGSENTFYRNFLKVHGMPPTSWKAKMQTESAQNPLFDSPAEIESPDHSENSSPKND
ncbi:MAG: helix-turn-helix domain-containing protein [Candidatus Merdivicinus sp.]|jgi:AraC-like DNA-binding protein